MSKPEETAEEDEVILSQDIIDGWKERMVELSRIMRSAQHETKMLQRKIEAARVIMKTKAITDAE